MRAGDLDRRREVYKGASGRVLHLRRGCRMLQQAEEVRQVGAGAMWDADRVCRSCTGELDPRERNGLTDPQRRHLELASMDPDELGI